MYREKNRNANVKLVRAENVNMHKYRALVDYAIRIYMDLTLSSYSSCTKNVRQNIKKKNGNKGNSWTVVFTCPEE